MHNISIVTSLYYSEEYIKDFYNRTLIACDEIFDDIEFIFVNDGSPDNSSNYVKDLCKKDRRVKLIELSRNFGHHKALMTGLDHAMNDLIWMIDVDLEEKPEWIIKFYAEYKKCNVDVVYGTQKSRKGTFFKRWSGKLFFILMDYISDLKLQKNCTTARLMNQEYKKSLCQFKEYNTNLLGLWKITGYNQKSIYVDKSRSINTTYSKRKQIKFAIDSVINFSTKPLVIIFFIGISIFLISLLLSIILTFKYLFLGTAVTGWTSLMISVWFIGGFLIGTLGLIGMYIAKIFIQTKNRPYTIIKEIYPSTKFD